MFKSLCLVALVSLSGFSLNCLAAGKTVGVFVALADNEHQGIVPVPKALGTGDDPERNLYWGSADGLATVFNRSKQWKLTEHTDTENGDILRTRTYQHPRTNTLLYARAYNGAAIQQAVKDFESAIANDSYDLVVFIGHNGLMDFQLAAPTAQADSSKTPDSIVLACKSEKYFKERIQDAGGRPILLTTQFMYPGAFILHAALNDWLADGDLGKIRASAGQSYAKNQRISTKAATGVFSNLNL